MSVHANITAPIYMISVPYIPSFDRGSLSSVMLLLIYYLWQSHTLVILLWNRIQEGALQPPF